MITVVSTSTCVWCVKVKELLALHNIPFVEWVPSRKELSDLLIPKGLKTVPQVFNGDPRDTLNEVTRIGGYEDTQAWIKEQYSHP